MTGSFYCLPAAFGRLVFLANDAGTLCGVRVELDALDAPDSAPESIACWMRTADEILATGRNLTEAERRALFSLPRMQSLSAFARQTLEAAGRIPAGRMLSYSRIARDLGEPNAARAVARALAANPFPVLIACHRVMTLEEIEAIDLTRPESLAGRAYCGQSALTRAAAWLRLQDFSQSVPT